MALNSALVDSARRLTLVPGPRVEGTTRYTEQLGPWFKARLTLGTGIEPEDTYGARRRTTSVTTLLFAARDADGDPVGMLPTDKVVVASPNLAPDGDLTFQVVGYPEPLRKKRRVIGWQVQLSRVEEH